VVWMWGGDACVAHAHFRVERRVAHAAPELGKPLHRLGGLIRRIVGATLGVAPVPLPLPHTPKIHRIPFKIACSLQICDK
jgi:hypothetical protein